MKTRLATLLAGMLFLGASLGAQTTTISATVVDSDSIAWTGGVWKINFVPNPANPNPNVYNIGGVPLNPAVTTQSGSLDGSGAMSASVYQNVAITPAGSQWKLTVCPNATAPCGSYTFPAAGSSMDLSSALTATIPAPRFHPVSGQYGYSDVEAILSLLPGSTYWNVTSVGQRCYTGSGWGNCGSGSGNLNCGTLTIGYYPVATGASTCANGTIDYNVTNSGANTSSVPFYGSEGITGSSSTGQGMNSYTTESSSLGFTPLSFNSACTNTTIINNECYLWHGWLGGSGYTFNETELGFHLVSDGSTSNWGFLDINGLTGGPTHPVQWTHLSWTFNVNPIVTGCTSGYYLKGDGTGCGVPSGSGITQLTGDVTAGPGSGSQAATLATVNSGPGACGDSTHVCAVTTNGKGLVTAQSATAISFPGSGFTSGNNSNGYWVEDPLGHIHEWGVINDVGGIVTGSTVTFPVVFTNASSVEVNATSITVFGDGIGFLSIRASTVTTTGFVVEAGAETTTDGIQWSADGY